MKTIKELLELVLKEFNNTKYNDHDYAGLCKVCKILMYYDIIQYVEYDLIIKYLKHSKRNFKVLYDVNYNVETNPYYLECHVGFYWKPYNKRYRIAWLKKHIKLNK